MSLGIPLVPFYDEEFDDEDFYYDSSADTNDPELKAFRARKEEDDEDFQDSLDFEAERRLLRNQDRFYQGWAEEYFSGKWRFEEETRESEEEWVELPTLFFESGALFIFGKIDNEVANNIIGSILLLNEETENIDELTFFINSPGGFLKSGLAIFDMMQSCDLDLGLHTVGLGLVASTASLILCAGDDKCRGAFQHTRVMIHQPTGEFRLKSEEKKKKEEKKEKKSPQLPTGNKMDELTSYLDEFLELRQRVIDIYAFTTQKDADAISRDIERDFFMSAEDAHAYGLIDQVIGKREVDEESVYIDNLDREYNPEDSYINFLQDKEDFEKTFEKDVEKDFEKDVEKDFEKDVEKDFEKDVEKEELQYEDRNKEKDLEEKEIKDMPEKDMPEKDMPEKKIHKKKTQSKKKKNQSKKKRGGNNTL